MQRGSRLDPYEEEEEDDSDCDGNSEDGEQLDAEAGQRPVQQAQKAKRRKTIGEETCSKEYPNRPDITARLRTAAEALDVIKENRDRAKLARSQKREATLQVKDAKKARAEMILAALKAQKVIDQDQTTFHVADLRAFVQQVPEVMKNLPASKTAGNTPCPELTELVFRFLSATRSAIVA